MSGSRCLKCLKSVSPSEAHYGLHPSCFLNSFRLKELLNFTGIARKSAGEDSLGRSSGIQEHSSFFHGKFKKYSAELGKYSYILKVQETDAPELPEVEYVSNQIAETLGIPVARFYLIEFFSQRTFVTKNFISHQMNMNLTHIYHYKKPNIPLDLEGLVQIIAQETKQFRDIQILLHVCLFDSLIGNHDRHGRNLGLLITPIGSELAPIYDNPSALGLESGAWLQADFSPKGRIPTQNSTEPSARDYVMELKRLGYEKEVSLFISQINLTKIDRLIDRSFCSDLMKIALKKLIHSRSEEMKNAFAARSE